MGRIVLNLRTPHHRYNHRLSLYKKFERMKSRARTLSTLPTPMWALDGPIAAHSTGLAHRECHKQVRPALGLQRFVHRWRICVSSQFRLSADQPGGALAHYMANAIVGRYRARPVPLV
jgi:hypothetical protein